MSARKAANVLSARKAGNVMGARKAGNVSARGGTAFSAARIAARVAAMGKEISRECKGRRLDVVVILERGFVFAADLIRQIDAPAVVHFVSEDVREVVQSGHKRCEVFFGHRPELKGRDVLVVDAVIESGVTQEFLLRRLGESRPRSLRLAVLLDKPARRRISLEPDYFGFRTASKDIWVGCGLAAANGMGRNLRALASSARAASTKGGKGRKK
jgi:hypoxanthine phosphoribosyltransferase